MFALHGYIRRDSEISDRVTRAELSEAVYCGCKKGLNYVWVAWPSGLRRWFKAPVSSEAWVRIPPLPLNTFCLFDGPTCDSLV